MSTETERINITGSNIYSYKITSEGFTASQPFGKNLLVQNTPYIITTEEWKDQAKRLEVAKGYVYNKNLLLLKEARIAAKERIKKIYEIALWEPVEIDGVMWDARKESLLELIGVQIISMDAGIPIEFNDAKNITHTFPYPAAKKGVFLPLVPILSQIGFASAKKIKLKNKLYADIDAMTDIDAIKKFNPIDTFGISGVDTKYL